MPRKPRNPGSGKPPHNGPAQGPGWGGPAKGEGNGSDGKLVPGAAPKAGCAIQGVEGFVPVYDALQDRERIEALKRHQWQQAFAGAYEGNRIAATQHLLERLDGKATQRTELTGRDGTPLVVVTGVPRPDAD